MRKKGVMVPVSEVDLTTVKYKPEAIQAPHLTGLTLKLFVNLIETPLIGPMMLTQLKKQNEMIQVLQNTVIPETPMFKPEFPPQVPEACVISLEEDGKPVDRVELALPCLPQYDAFASWTGDDAPYFRYWKIRDYAHAYRSKITTPSKVAERFISAIEEFSNKNPLAPLLITFDAEDIRKHAAASTQRIEEGGTTWFHEVRPIKKDAICVSKLRSCGVMFVGKANIHEVGLRVTGNNPCYGTVRNPQYRRIFIGSSGPAAIVASGFCPAALGTDGGGSIRIPSSLCGVVGFKTTYGRIEMGGSLCDAGTVEIIGPLASNVEDVMLMYDAVLGSSTAERTCLRPTLPYLPNLSSQESTNVLGSLQLGKYTEWFNDVFSTEISEKCDSVLHLLSEKLGCKTVEIVIPELPQMRVAHVVSIGSQSLCSLTPDCEDGKNGRLSYDTRTNLALFGSFSAADYVAAQRNEG